ncbi:MAG: hypothetical protein ABIP20_17130 [Chthoniobacteraceae bacterium]
MDLYLNSICQTADCFALAAPQPPRLPDSDDEPLLQLAEASGARLITTHNLRHVRAAAAHGITVLPPREFLRAARSSTLRPSNGSATAARSELGGFRPHHGPRPGRAAVAGG